MRANIITFLIFMPFLAVANTLVLDLSAEEPAGSMATTTTTVTTTTTTSTLTTTTTTSTTLKSAKVFTSPLLNKVLTGDAPASDLPYWYGFRWNRSIHPVVDDWTDFLYKEIEANAPALIETNPKGVTNFCPQFEKLNKDERILFWVRLVSVLISFESEFHPEKTYDDSKNIVGEEKVISSGLMMLSHESVMPEIYGCTMISKDPVIGQKDLLDPKKNMACGIRVMNRWIKEDAVMADRDENSAGEVVWKGLARYWGPFRHVMLKKDEEGLWGALLKRLPRWQQESDIRDQYLQTAVKESIQSQGQAIDKKVWEAAASKAPHPSLLDEKYHAEESHPFSSIVRIMNQTGFCYK